MYVVDTDNGKKLKALISEVDESDFKTLTKSKYYFDWSTEKDFELYKLIIEGKFEILGLISLVRIPDELRIHISLLTVSKDNVGKGKKYENIAANLLTHASEIAIIEYAEFACVSLKPKGRIAQHYIDKYDMNVTGATLSLELVEILNLINTYDHEK